MVLTSSFVINPHGSIFGRFEGAMVVLDFWQLAKVASRPIEKRSMIWRLFDVTNALIMEVSSFVFRPPAARPTNRSAKKPALPKTNSSDRTRGDGKPGRKAARASCRTWRSPSRRKIAGHGHNQSRQKWRR